jgi:hypothetical protein
MKNKILRCQDAGEKKAKVDTIIIILREMNGGIFLQEGDKQRF